VCQMQNVQPSFLALLVHLPLDEGWRLARLLQHSMHVLEHLEPLYASLDHPLELASFFHWCFVLVSFEELAVALSFICSGYVWVADEDPRNLLALLCGQRWKAGKKVVDLFCQLPGVRHSSIWVMKLRGFTGEICLLWRSGSARILVAKPVAWVELCHAALETLGGVLVTCGQISIVGL